MIIVVDTTEATSILTRANWGGMVSVGLNDNRTHVVDAIGHYCSATFAAILKSVCWYIYMYIAFVECMKSSTDAAVFMETYRKRSEEEGCSERCRSMSVQ